MDDGWWMIHNGVFGEILSRCCIMRLRLVQRWSLRTSKNIYWFYVFSFESRSWLLPELQGLFWDFLFSPELQRFAGISFSRIAGIALENNGDLLPLIADICFQYLKCNLIFCNNCSLIDDCFLLPYLSPELQGFRSRIAVICFLSETEVHGWFDALNDSLRWTYYAPLCFRWCTIENQFYD